MPDLPTLLHYKCKSLRTTHMHEYTLCSYIMHICTHTPAEEEEAHTHPEQLTQPTLGTSAFLGWPPAKRFGPGSLCVIPRWDELRWLRRGCVYLCGCVWGEKSRVPQGVRVRWHHINMNKTVPVSRPGFLLFNYVLAARVCVCERVCLLVIL